MKNTGFSASSKDSQPSVWNALDYVTPDFYEKLREDHPGLMRIREVVRLTGRSRTSIYMDSIRGRFPRSLKIGIQSVAWRAADIYPWIESRPYA